MAKYGYARVSTAGQATKGNSLESQVEILIQEGVPRENIFIDASSGAKTDRPEFQKLLGHLKAGDVLVVSKLDRFARSLVQGSTIIDRLLSEGVVVNILNIGRLDNSPTSQLIRNIFLSFAEFERSMILERVTEGKAVARLKDDYREGRPKKYNGKQVQHALGLLDHNSYKEVESLTGISKSTLIRAKKEVVGRMVQ